MDSPQTQAASPRRRLGFHRWLIIGVIVLSAVSARAFRPIMPHIQVAPEPLTGAIELPWIGELRLTNTMVALLTADAILVAMAWAVHRALRPEEMIPRGIASVVDAVMEALTRLVESTAGRWGRQIFPWVATTVLLVLLVNWMELLPGVDSIGLLHAPEEGMPAYTTRPLFSLGRLSVRSLASEAHSVQEGDAGFVPFVRVASTDLNFTVALALVAVGASQIMGVRAAGAQYFKKFFNFGPLLRMLFRERLGPFDLLTPFINVFVGLLELIAEFARIISFSFRLFGNIFAGSVLLFVIGSLVPVVVQSGFLILELFVGLVQALVFGILTLVFMSMATMVHGEHEEGRA